MDRRGSVSGREKCFCIKSEATECWVNRSWAGPQIVLFHFALISVGFSGSGTCISMRVEGEKKVLLHL